MNWPASREPQVCWILIVRRTAPLLRSGAMPLKETAGCCGIRAKGMSNNVTNPVAKSLRNANLSHLIELVEES